MAYIDYGEDDCDSIFEIDPSGATTEVFESNDVAEIREVACHGNAVRYSKTENVYTLSELNVDVFIVNRSGSVEWRLSEIAPGGREGWGGRNHGHHLLDDSMLVFGNNGGDMSSALFEFSLTGEVILDYDPGLLTAIAGDIQRLPKGNTLASFGITSVIQEIDPNGNLVLEIEGNGSRISYVSWHESLYGSPP